MNEKSTPDMIYSDFLNNYINRATAIDLLISLIEGHQQYNIIIDAINILGNIGKDNPKAFRIIENCLISDENALVRKISAKLVFLKFQKKMNLLPLKWSSQFEDSVIVIKKLLDLFNRIDDPHYNILKQIIIKRLKENYSVDSNYIDLFLNIEVIYANYLNEFGYKINSGWFKVMRMLNKYSHAKELIHFLYYIKLGGTHQIKEKFNSIKFLKASIFNKEIT